MAWRGQGSLDQYLKRSFSFLHVQCRCVFKPALLLPIIRYFGWKWGTCVDDPDFSRIWGFPDQYDASIDQQESLECEQIIVIVLYN